MDSLLQQLNAEEYSTQENADDYAMMVMMVLVVSKYLNTALWFKTQISTTKVFFFN